MNNMYRTESLVKLKGCLSVSALRNAMRRTSPLLFLSTLMALSVARADAPPSMRLDVDAREISRKLLHSREELAVQPGQLALWYPKWIPGTHSPGGPIQNLGGMRLETIDGKPIPWRRDEAEVCRIQCTVPSGVEKIVVLLDYICNQPSVNSDGVDSFGNTQLGVINWNTCLLYPENVSIDDLRVKARLLLPPKWRFGTALKATEESPGVLDFKPETLRDLVDCPLICGEYLRTIELKPKNFPPVFLHLASESQEAVQLDEKLIEKYRNVAAEAGALFGGAHFDEYHFLVTCSDQVGQTGLEHLSSSMNAVGERDLVDEKQRRNSFNISLLPHEFCHSWCGKHRRPAGMVTANFHTPERTSLLWVYEGLTQYLGDVLTVRSGLGTSNSYLSFLSLYVDFEMRTEGRQWRPLEDTAIANHILRDRSKSWGRLRRGQDYYVEGELLWLEIDAIIRQQSDGRRSLDDFCKKFMGPQRKEQIVPYDRAEIIQILKELADYDWESFLRQRVDEPQTELPLTFVERCGYRLQYATQPSEFLKEVEQKGKFITASFDSLGMGYDEEGTVADLVPGMAADKAGMTPGMKVQGVNGRKFSRERLQDAIADSVTKRQVEFLVLDGDTYRTFTVPYADGPKYLELIRDPSKPDILMSILKPTVATP